jgi:hypothetical protein
MPEIFVLGQARRNKPPVNIANARKANAMLAILSDMRWSSNLTDVVGDFRKHQSNPSKVYFPQN